MKRGKLIVSASWSQSKSTAKLLASHLSLSILLHWPHLTLSVDCARVVNCSSTSLNESIWRSRRQPQSCGRRSMRCATCTTTKFATGILSQKTFCCLRKMTIPTLNLLILASLNVSAKMKLWIHRMERPTTLRLRFWRVATQPSAIIGPWA